MQTQEAKTRFLKHCEEAGRALATRRTYHTYLRYFVKEHPDLPLDTNTIEQFLKKRKETPAHRGQCFKVLQAFYSYLEMYENIKSPVPPKGPVGRPRTVKLVTPETWPPMPQTHPIQMQKLVEGGPFRIELHVYLHTRRS